MLHIIDDRVNSVYDGIIELNAAMTREMHPNSLKALADAQQARKKGAKRVNMTLSLPAIAALDRIASTLEISRSELVERLARADDAAIMELLRGKLQ